MLSFLIKVILFENVIRKMIKLRYNSNPIYYEIDLN